MPLSHPSNLKMAANSPKTRQELEAYLHNGILNIEKFKKSWTDPDLRDWYKSKNNLSNSIQILFVQKLFKGLVQNQEYQIALELWHDNQSLQNVYRNSQKDRDSILHSVLSFELSHENCNFIKTFLTTMDQFEVYQQALAEIEKPSFYKKVINRHAHELVKFLQAKINSFKVAQATLFESYHQLLSSCEQNDQVEFDELEDLLPKEFMLSKDDVEELLKASQTSQTSTAQIFQTIPPSADAFQMSSRGKEPEPNFIDPVVEFASMPALDAEAFSTIDMEEVLASLDPEIPPPKLV